MNNRLELIYWNEKIWKAALSFRFFAHTRKMLSGFCQGFFMDLKKIYLVFKFMLAYLVLTIYIVFKVTSFKDTRISFLLFVKSFLRFLIEGSTTFIILHHHIPENNSSESSLIQGSLCLQG